MDKENIDIIHAIACKKKKSTYKDPDTNRTVFTEFFLIERGYCCDSDCRHCPYKGEINYGEKRAYKV